jgi:hypothetical protein
MAGRRAQNNFNLKKHLNTEGAECPMIKADKMILFFLHPSSQFRAVHDCRY